MTAKLRIISLILVAAGCGTADVDPPTPTSSGTADQLTVRSETEVRFQFTPGGVPAWGEVPFPSDLYRDEGGRITIDGFPNTLADSVMFRSTFELLADRDGFCTTCNITFMVDGELSVPLPDDALQLIELETLERVPVRWQWDPEAGALAVRPDFGAVLTAGRQYAAVVTTAALGVDDLPLAASEDLASFLGGDLEIPHMGAALGPLAEVGIEPDSIAGLTVFTTSDPTGDLRVIRELVQQGPAPSITVDRVWTGAELDELLGRPADVRAGIDRPTSSGEGRAIRHFTTAAVIAGTFSAPRFTTGSGRDVGAVQRHDDGTPEIASREGVPFLLIVPHAANLSELGVVVSHHGFSASRTTGFALADTAGRAGYAVLSFDAYLHGERASSAGDSINAQRGIASPDGFAETNQLDIITRTFGFSGAPAEEALAPKYPLSAFLQFAADAMSAVRLVAESDTTPLSDAFPELDGLSFDAERIVYVGNSMGAVVGVSVMSVEPAISAAVLNVMPGSIIETLAESAEFRPLSQRMLLPKLGVDAVFDERERSMLFDPTVDLYRWALEPVDPLALAPFLESRRIADSRPTILVQLATRDEVAAPRPSESVVRAGALSRVTRYEGAMHGMMEVTVQHSQWQMPLIPPLTRRTEPQVVVNPVNAVHDEIERFLHEYP